MSNFNPLSILLGQNDRNHEDTRRQIQNLRANNEKAFSNQTDTIRDITATSNERILRGIETSQSKLSSDFRDDLDRQERSFSNNLNAHSQRTIDNVRFVGAQMEGAMAAHQKQTANSIHESQVQTSRDMQANLDRQQKIYQDFSTAHQQKLNDQIKLSKKDTSRALLSNQLQTERALNNLHFQTLHGVERNFQNQNQFMSEMIAANGERNFNAFSASQREASRNIQYNNDKNYRSLTDTISLQNEKVMSHAEFLREKSAHNAAMHQLDSQRMIFDTQNQAIDKIYNGMDRQTEAISGKIELNNQQVLGQLKYMDERNAHMVAASAFSTQNVINNSTQNAVRDITTALDRQRLSLVDHRNNTSQQIMSGMQLTSERTINAIKDYQNDARRDILDRIDYQSDKNQQNMKDLIQASQNGIERKIELESERNFRRLMDHQINSERFHQLDASIREERLLRGVTQAIELSRERSKVIELEDRQRELEEKSRGKFLGIF